MNIIEGLGFNNFRVFTKPTNLDFAPITILTGTNNSGKSTVINGLRLIHANYKDLPDYSNLRHPNKMEKFELNSLFSKDFNVDAIIQRYGSLEKMVSFGSEQNVFSFCIQKKMRMIDDIALIEFTIAIQDNKVKNGRLIKLIITSKKTKEEIFRIEEITGNPQDTSGDSDYYVAQKNRGENIFRNLAVPGNPDYYDHHIAKINLNFYFSHFLEWIKKNRRYYDELYTITKMIQDFNEGNLEIELLNRKINQVNSEYESYIQLIENLDGKYNFTDDPLFFTTDIGISQRKLAIIETELKDGLFYNFSFLWENRPEDEMLFEQLIKKIYGKFSIASLTQLNEDILRTLTKNKWKYKSVSGPEKTNLGVSYINFKKGFSLSLFWDSIGIERYGIVGVFGVHRNRIPGAFAFLSSDLIEKTNKKEELVELLCNMINERNKKFNSEEIGLEEHWFEPENKEKSEKGEYKLPGFISSESEKYFNDAFLLHNLNLINECFQPFKLIDFISADRANSNRVKSLLEKDDLSRLVRNLLYMDSESGKLLEEFTELWFKKFGVADKVTFNKDEDSENFKIILSKNEQRVLLADMGYGATQLLPIMLACFPKMEEDYNLENVRKHTPKVVVIEEPESNLHPALQSKLADFFIDASKKFNIQFIIETHSEYLIRKLQFLTANKELSPEDTVIYYFSPLDKEQVGEQVKKINIRRDGMLTADFGDGFFDESARWSFELLKLQNLS